MGLLIVLYIALGYERDCISRSSAENYFFMTFLTLVLLYWCTTMHGQENIKISGDSAPTGAVVYRIMNFLIP
jgi:hypothetical protein